MLVAKLEANKEDIIALVNEHVRNDTKETDNLFDFEELALNLSLAERIANRIKQILKKTQGLNQNF